MKRLLLPLLAALAFPTAVNAESYPYYLLLSERSNNNWIVPMESQASCESALKTALEAENWSHPNKHSKPIALLGIFLKSE